MHLSGYMQLGIMLQEKRYFILQLYTVKKISNCLLGMHWLLIEAYHNHQAQIKNQYNLNVSFNLYVNTSPFSIKIACFLAGLASKLRSVGGHRFGHDKQHRRRW